MTSMLSLFLFTVCTCALVTAFTSSRAPLLLRPSPLLLKAVSAKEIAYVDGGEWMSLQKYMNLGQYTPVGKLNVVTGTAVDSGTRVVGLVAPEELEGETFALDAKCHVWKDSMAEIPNRVDDRTAISTFVAAMTGVHCALPRGIGGSDDTVAVGSKVAVMGGSDFAQFVAKGLAAMGAEVSLVTTGNSKVEHPNGE